MIVTGWILFGVSALSALINIFVEPTATSLETEIKIRPFKALLSVIIAIWMGWALRQVS